MVYRVYVEKKEELANEAKALLADLAGLLGVNGLTGVRIVNRYDVEHIEKELFDDAKKTVFSEPQLDVVSEELDTAGASAVFAVEYLPGQFDSEPIPPPSVSRSFPRRNGPRFARPRSTFCTESFPKLR